LTYKESHRLANEVIDIFRINDIIDLPVFDSISSQRICTIRDVIIDLRERRVYALVCKERFLKRSLEAIPFRNVEGISQGSVKISGKTSLISAGELRIKQRRYQSYQTILGKLVLNFRGDTLGIVRDIIIESNSGIIKAYELSEGYIDDFLRGRHIVEMGCGHTLAGKNIILKDHNAQYPINKNN
jgi:uncharacterized protein YrrD